MSPKTEWGKIATIFYAIIGMPLFLLYLSNIGDILAKSFKWVYAKVCLCRICPGVARRRAVRERRKTRSQLESISSNVRDHSISFDRFNLKIILIIPFFPQSDQLEYPYGAGRISQDGHDDDDDDDEDDEDISNGSIELEITGDTRTVTVPLTISLTIMIGYMMFGALLFARWEGWGMLDGSYFCFISLSSIGFGDIVPGFQITGKGDSIVELSSALCAIYLLLGMALIAMCFNLMQEQVIHMMASFKRAIQRCFRCSR